MNNNTDQIYIIEDTKELIKPSRKRKCDNEVNEVPHKKLTEYQPAEQNGHKTNESDCETHRNISEAREGHQDHKHREVKLEEDIISSASKIFVVSPQKEKNKTFVPRSPKKRLDIECDNKQDKKKNVKQKFIYGNYSQYYGYRNNNSKNPDKDQDFHDIRLDIFQEHPDVFRGKAALDIGCNNGFITMQIAKKLDVKSMAGIDIDKQLINQAIKNLIKHKKSLPMDNELKRTQKFPFNVTFVHGNYVLRDEVLLEIEKPQFDVVLCLSVTKWIHLNFGDAGLKMAFKRMFLQLRANGVLILEAQPYDNYGRRKKMNDTIFNNYKNMQFFPKDFNDYLLSPEVGFSKMIVLGVPDHCKKGFKRPVQIFYKV